jgi:hypothetical protein
MIAVTLSLFGVLLSAREPVTSRVARVCRPSARCSGRRLRAAAEREIVRRSAHMNELLAVLILPAFSCASTLSSASRCPSATNAMARASVFETRVGVTGCLTPRAEAFMLLYDARDVGGFRALGDSPTAGAQLYGLCGLIHVGATAEAEALRKKLISSQEVTAIHMGCTGSGPRVPVGTLVVAKDGGSVSEFDSVCDDLVEAGTRPSRNLCETGEAHLTCP